MIDLRMPNITAATPQGQIEQVKSYLFQMAQQLNVALAQVETMADEAQKTASSAATPPSQVEQAQDTFNSIKSLIIKSADIIDSYTESIETKLSGKYVAQSDFGDYIEETDLKISANSTSIEQAFSNAQTIKDELNGRIDEIASNAYIRSGELAENEGGHPIYGIEVGQTNTDDDGNETFNKFARFTADRLSFYDSNGIEVAYLSDSTLYITTAVVKGKLQIGKFELDPTYGLALVWVGG